MDLSNMLFLDNITPRSFSKEGNPNLFPILPQSLQKYHSFLIRRNIEKKRTLKV